MTTEEIRIAIAEHLGWQKRREPEGSINPFAWWQNETRYPSMEESPYPDYPNDLNAMHEAEKTLTPEQQNQFYQVTLPQVTGSGGFSIRFQNTRRVVSATAEQRAEAFLRTIGKWKD